MLLPESRVDALLDEAGVNPNAPEDGMTGAWNLDVMLKSGSAHIERDMEQILAGHGFQSEDAAGEDYIRSGVNWGSHRRPARQRTGRPGGGRLAAVRCSSSLPAI